MLEFILNQAVHVEKIPHQDPDVSIYVVDDFLENPQALVDYARAKAYFGDVGEDRTAYPGIRDRLPRAYEQVLESVIELVYGIRHPGIHRCMLSLTTLQPDQLKRAQKIPHVDAFSDEQFAAVHYLCDAPHGGTAFYRYLPRNIARMREPDKEVISEMLQGVEDYPEEHVGYLTGNTRFYRQEALVQAKFNRLILYPSNVLHCAQLDSSQSFVADIAQGRLSVASFFEFRPVTQPHVSFGSGVSLLS